MSISTTDDKLVHFDLTIYQPEYSDNIKFICDEIMACNHYIFELWDACSQFNIKKLLLEEVFEEFLRKNRNVFINKGHYLGFIIDHLANKLFPTLCTIVESIGEEYGQAEKNYVLQKIKTAYPDLICCCPLFNYYFDPRGSQIWRISRSKYVCLKIQKLFNLLEAL